ncbi:tetratricopeptide repeat protein [Candidatus Neomarinimicrobiota bacterium]
MFPSINAVRRTAFLLALPLLIGLITGCANSSTTEVPITTVSDEARATYIEARQLAENLSLDDARAMYEKAIEQDPGFALAYWGRAILAISNKDFRDYFNQAVALAPNVSRGERLLIEGNQALADDKPETALKLRKKLVRKFPNDKRVHNALGGVYFGLDEVEPAIAAYEKAAELDADYPPPYNVLGYLYLAEHQFDKAENAFKNYIRLIPDEANVYDSMADLYTRMGRYQEAIDNFSMALERNPTFGFSQRKIGLNQIYMGRYDDGRASISQAIALEQTPFGRVVDLEMIAFSHLYENNPDETFRAMGEALDMAKAEQLTVRVALIRSGLCRLHLLITGDLDQAEAELRAYIKIIEAGGITEGARDFFAELALTQEALIAAKGKDFDRAFAKADELEASIAAGENPTETEGYHQLMGQIYLDKGEYSKALEQFDQGNEDNPYTYYLMAQAQANAGSHDRAKELYQRTVDWNEVISAAAGNHHRALGYALARTKSLAALQE